MKVMINGVETEVDPQGVVRWLGKWFTEYQMPKDFILLSDAQFDACLKIRRETGTPPKKKDRNEG